jgi:hypothetical protein
MEGGNMQKGIVLSVCLTLIAFAGLIPSRIPAPKRISLEVEQLPVEMICEYKGVTTAPPWCIDRDAPWDPNIQIPDVYSRDDQMVSMAVDATGRIYVCYQAIYNASPLRYGVGIASSTDNGITWDNRVFRTGGTTYSISGSEISIMDDGKIWIWSNITGGTINAPCFMRSKIGWFNNPDSLAGFGYFSGFPDRLFPEVVTRGVCDELVFAQYSVDHAGTANDSIFCIFSEDSTAWYVFTFVPSGGYPEKTSIGVDYDGTVDILIHGVEFYDAAGSDWDVACYLDTLQGSGNFYGWSTGNTYDDRYPSVFCSQGYAYIAFQSDMGTGESDIILNYSTDYGATWAPTMVDITNDTQDETYPRVYGQQATVGVGYLYGGLGAYFNYSVQWGQDGTWLTTPEIMDDNTSVNSNYHCIGLLYTIDYMYSAWEDTRVVGTVGIDIYTSRRTTPIGINEYREDRLFNTSVLAAPNPFRTSVHIDYSIERPADVVITIYDITGAEVRTLVQDKQGSGNHTITWNGMDARGRTVSAGVYVCTFKVGDQAMSKDIVFMH